MIKKKILKVGPRVKKTVVYEEAPTSGSKAMKKEKILSKYSIAQQLNTIREAILMIAPNNTNLTELKEQFQYIKDILDSESKKI